MNGWSSQSVTIELGPTFGSHGGDVGRVRSGQISWIDEMEMSVEPIFTLDIPLEVVGVAASGPSALDDSVRSPPSLLTFTPCGDVTVEGITPDSAVRDVLLGGDEMGMSVDSLSRSVILTDIDERTFVETLRSRADIDPEGLAALKHALLVPTFYESDDLNEEAATQAQKLLTENIRQHEREHIRCLIDPETAIWREFELYWRSISAGIQSQCRPEFLRRLARVYTIPSHFTAELLAIVAEDYTTDNPIANRAVETKVAARRGVVETLWQFIDDHNIDTDLLDEMLRSPVGEQYCDLWLAYILDEFRSGRSLAEIDASGFHDTCTPQTATYGDRVRDPETRTAFVDYICELCYGPVFELIRLKFVDGTFVLERAWFSLNTGVSDAERLLAVRRALFRRQFLPTFGTQSGLDDILDAREAAVEEVIRGAPLDEVSLFDVSLPSSEQLTNHLMATQQSNVEALLGPRATTDHLTTWLNDPEFGFNR